VASDPSRVAGGPNERAAGERAAELFQEHGRMVYGLCRLLLRDPVEADDATQATFVSAFKSLLGGGAVREPAAWLGTIARNECRARSHARMRQPLALLDDDIGHSWGPHEELNRRIVVEEIREAIAGLPDKQREAVVLRDLYGLRYDEVGAALGVSRPSVEALLFRARRSLRVSLKPLASGALAVPIAVREGIAQALPGFAASAAGPGALAGGMTVGAASGGLLAKLTAAPVAAKLAAVVAVGAGVVGAERAARPDVAPRAAQQAPLVASTHPGAPPRDSRLGRGATEAAAGPVSVSAAAGDVGVAGAVDDDDGGGMPHGGTVGGDDTRRGTSARERTEDRSSRLERAGSEPDEEEKASSSGFGGTGEDDDSHESSATERAEPRAEHPGDDRSRDGADEEATTALERPEGEDRTDGIETETEVDEPEADDSGEDDASDSDDGGEHEDEHEDGPEESEPPA
jgi:RNA polymerase sigma factor (sigma-70 family)